MNTRTASSSPSPAHAATPAPLSRRGWRYDSLAMGLHWAVAVLIVAAAALGWFMVSVEDEPGAGWYFVQHKSLGLLIALLVVARLAWRLAHRPAELPNTVPYWQVRLSNLSQWSLYVLMAAMPLTGYLGASYSKNGVQFYGLATPAWTLPDNDVAERYFAVHSVLIWALAALIAFHALGALKHLVLDRDGVFERMWPRKP